MKHIKNALCTLLYSLVCLWQLYPAAAAYSGQLTQIALVDPSWKYQPDELSVVNE